MKPIFGSDEEQHSESSSSLISVLPAEAVDANPAVRDELVYKPHANFI